MGIHIPGWQPHAWTSSPQAWTNAFDIIVVGGGISGCAAAVAAARRGARVAITEPTHMLGGQWTVGGVGTADYWAGSPASQDLGLWGEVVRRTETIYGSYGLTGRVARYRPGAAMAANAPIADRVLTEMCHEAGVEVLRNCAVTSATITTARATLITAAGVMTSSVAVDATEDGSLLALADFPFRAGTQVGRGMSLPGAPTRIQSVTQCAVVRRYDEGIPQALRVAEPPPDYDLYRTQIAAAYPGRPWGTTHSDNDFAGYRAYPDIADQIYYNAYAVEEIRRTSLNLANDQPATTAYLTDPEARADTVTRGIHRTLAVIHYLQAECGLNWAIAQDEGFREGPSARTLGIRPAMPDWIEDLPVIPYLRESRRLIGAYMLTGRRIRRPDQGIACAWSSQTIAVGTYKTDLHGSMHPEDFETDLGETVDDLNGAYGPFPVPFGSLVPADDRRLVVAEKNLSMSRGASGAVRVHPSVTAVGEAAGVIAALAWKQGVAPRKVAPQATQISLLRRGALLLPYPIYGMSMTHRDYPAVALALLNGKAGYKVDNDAHGVRLSSSQLSGAVHAGRNLLAQWQGPL